MKRSKTTIIAVIALLSGLSPNSAEAGKFQVQCEAKGRVSSFQVEGSGASASFQAPAKLASQKRPDINEAKRWGSDELCGQLDNCFGQFREIAKTAQDSLVILERVKSIESKVARAKETLKSVTEPTVLAKTLERLRQLLAECREGLKETQARAKPTADVRIDYPLAGINRNKRGAYNREAIRSVIEQAINAGTDPYLALGIVLLENPPLAEKQAGVGYSGDYGTIPVDAIAALDQLGCLSPNWGSNGNFHAINADDVSKWKALVNSTRAAEKKYERLLNGKEIKAYLLEKDELETQRENLSDLMEDRRRAERDVQRVEKELSRRTAQIARLEAELAKRDPSAAAAAAKTEAASDDQPEERELASFKTKKKKLGWPMAPDTNQVTDQVKKAMDELNVSIEQLADASMGVQATTVDDLVNWLKSHKESVRELEKERAELIKERSAKEDEIEDARKAIPSLEAKVATLARRSDISEFVKSNEALDKVTQEKDQFFSDLVEKKGVKAGEEIGCIDNRSQCYTVLKDQASVPKIDLTFLSSYESIFAKTERQCTSNSQIMRGENPRIDKYNQEGCCADVVAGETPNTLKSQVKGWIGAQFVRDQVQACMSSQPLTYCIQKFNGLGCFNCTEKMNNDCFNGIVMDDRPVYGARVADLMVNSLMSNKDINALVEQATKNIGKPLISSFCLQGGAGTQSFATDKYLEEQKAYLLSGGEKTYKSRLRADGGVRLKMPESDSEKEIFRANEQKRKVACQKYFN